MESSEDALLGSSKIRAAALDEITITITQIIGKKDLTKRIKVIKKLEAKTRWYGAEVMGLLPVSKAYKASF
jgi:hypothetical protein